MPNVCREELPRTLLRTNAAGLPKRSAIEFALVISSQETGFLPILNWSASSEFPGPP